MLEQSKALKLFEYKNGKLYCKAKTSPKSNKKNIGEEVGGLNGQDYLVTKIYYKSYFVHKIIFLMHYGYIPQIVDHIDGNKNNNSIKNLQWVSIKENTLRYYDNSDKKAEILRLHTEGVSSKKITEQVGLHYSTVRQTILRAG